MEAEPITSESGDDEMPEEFKRTNRLRRLWRAGKRAAANAWTLAKGFRTLGTCAVTALFGLLDQYDVIDIISFIKNTFTENAKVGTVLVVIAVVFFALRAVTKTAIGAKPPGDDPAE
jgi:hypothetical protein